MSVKKDVGMQIKMNVKCFKDIDKLDRGEKIDEAQVFDIIDFANERHDCADFRLICLIKTYFDYRHNLSEKCQLAIYECMKNFKYWMDEPGNDGMCYWSENHQLLFASCELLAGQLLENEIFTNNGMSGKEHYDKAKARLLRWFDYKFKYGFIEWHSNTYYEEDIAPLCVLVDCAKDEKIVQRAKITLDLLFLDLAMHSFDGYFVASSGRCYELQKKDPANADVNDILRHAFGIQKGEYNFERISSMFLLCKNYTVPTVIVDIAKCQDKMKICDSMGFDLSNIRKEIKNSDINDFGMLLWQMEAFTNSQAVNNSIDVFNAWKLYDNVFLQDFKMINIKILRKLNLLPLLTKILNPAMNGVAIQRANVQTYKCKNYMLSTAQNYHPREFGDQQHVWQLSLKNGINIFSTHPGCAMFDDSARNFSPSFWVGNGVNPFAFQNDNVLLLGYKLNVRKGFMERNRQHLVHFHFPFDKFEKVILKDKSVFAKAGNSYVAIFSTVALEKKGTDELIARGKTSNFAVIVENGESFASLDEFEQSFKNATIVGNGSYTHFVNDKDYFAHFKRGLKIDDKPIRTNYDRLETPFANAKRGECVYNISIGNSRLELDGKNLTRREFYE